MNLLRYFLLVTVCVSSVSVTEAMPPKKAGGKKPTAKRSARQRRSRDQQAENRNESDVDEEQARPVQPSAENSGRTARNVAQHVELEDVANEQRCVVCHDAIEGEDGIPPREYFMCNHTVLHRDCADQWAAHNNGENNCPLCRAPQTQEMRARILHLVAEVRDRGVHQLRDALQPLNALVQQMAQDTRISRPLLRILKNIQTLMKHPQQFRREVLALGNNIFAAQRRANAAEAAYMNGFIRNLVGVPMGNTTLQQLQEERDQAQSARRITSLEGARAVLVKGLQHGQAGLALLERMVNPCPINLDRVQQDIMQLAHVINEHYYSSISNALQQVLQNISEIIPEVNVFVMQVQNIEDANIDQLFAYALLQPIIMQLAGEIAPMAPDIIQALGAIATGVPVPLSQQYELLCTTVRELLDLINQFIHGDNADMQ